MRKTTGLDWAGDPIEVENRFHLGHGEENYQQMVEHFKDYNDILGDHPQNLSATTLALNAYILTGEEKYKNWLLDYVDAWMDRMEENNGIIPSSVGLDGTIGGKPMENGGAVFTDGGSQSSFPRRENLLTALVFIAALLALAMPTCSPEIDGTSTPGPTCSISSTQTARSLME